MYLRNTGNFILDWLYLESYVASSNSWNDSKLGKVTNDDIRKTIPIKLDQNITDKSKCDAVQQRKALQKEAKLMTYMKLHALLTTFTSPARISTTYNGTVVLLDYTLHYSHNILYGQMSQGIFLTFCVMLSFKVLKLVTPPR